MCKECRDGQELTRVQRAQQVREIRKSSGGKLPDLNAIFKPVGHDGPHGELLNPKVHGDG